MHSNNTITSLAQLCYFGSSIWNERHNQKKMLIITWLRASYCDMQEGRKENSSTGSTMCYCSWTVTLFEFLWELLIINVFSQSRSNLLQVGYVVTKNLDGVHIRFKEVLFNVITSLQVDQEDMFSRLIITRYKYMNEIKLAFDVVKSLQWDSA